MLGSTPSATDFVVEIDNASVAHLRFGDGEYGMTTDPGTQFNAQYRIGNGTPGNVGLGAIAHVVTNASAISGVTNPIAASGGVDAETLACGCGAEPPLTPVTIDNRPGLSAIAYRIGTWGTFRAAMIAGLSQSAYPQLAALSTRDPSDFSLALLDAWAVTADVLTFYQERNANEAYLRTAVERMSVGLLAGLIGYQPRPGVAASTQLAFMLDTAPGAPRRRRFP